METMEILTLARETLLRRYEVATSMVRAKPCDKTKAYRDQIVDKTMEINRMINAEHQRKLDEAEAAAEEQKEPRYEVEVEYTSGDSRKNEYSTKEHATKIYNQLKDIMCSPAGLIIDRISMTENGVTIRSYERGEF